MYQQVKSQLPPQMSAQQERFLKQVSQSFNESYRTHIKQVSQFIEHKYQTGEPILERVI